MSESTPKRVGRPTKFTPLVAEQVFHLLRAGSTDVEIAGKLGLHRTTFTKWRRENPQFFVTCMEARAVSDEVVERKLFERACGYSHAAVKIFMVEGKPQAVPYMEHYPPDTQAAMFWLKNRRPDVWRERSEVATTVTVEQARIAQEVSQAPTEVLEEARSLLTRMMNPTKEPAR